MSSVSRNTPDWERAGMLTEPSGLLGASGFFIRPWIVPKNIDVVGDRLEFSYSGERPATADGMLDAFIRIENAHDVERFARRFGALDLCEHLVPYVHQLTLGIRGIPYCKPLSGSWVQQWEPIDRWLLYVDVARRVLRIAATLQAGKDVTPADLAELNDLWVGQVHDSFIEVAGDVEGFPLCEQATLWVFLVINQWLAFGHALPTLAADGAFSIEFSVGTFGAIGLQMLSAITRSQGLALCSGCGSPYMRTTRKAQSGRRNYCPACGRTVALRDAQRAYAARRRGQE